MSAGFLYFLDCNLWDCPPSSRYLQPQLQKAARQDEKESKGDVNPKDFILFYKGDFSYSHVQKDNTGRVPDNVETPLPHAV